MQFDCLQCDRMPPMASPHHARSDKWGRLGGAALLGLIMAAFYWLYFLPPRSMGERDPDRYYHLGLSKLMASEGLLRSLPQAEDLGWGHYFPDKEFLFHVLTGTAHWLGGPGLVLCMVPVLAIATLLCLYLELTRPLRPWKAALLVSLVALGTPAFMFRLTLLRPHLLAVLCFSLLIIAMLRGAPKLAALAAAAFALSYHAFYVVLIVAGVTWFFRRCEAFEGKRMWLWALIGLVLGILLNPYFPSNIRMSFLHLGLALGGSASPGDDIGMELRSFTWMKWTLAYGFIAVGLVGSVIMVWARRSPEGPEQTRFWFLAALTGVFCALGFKSPRAMEYAMPLFILTLGYGVALIEMRAWAALQLAFMLGIQGYVAKVHYTWYWRPRPSLQAEYSRVIAQIPARAKGSKIFNCEWWAGSYILLDRPDLRFVDLLEPNFLLQASREKYQVRQGLVSGQFPNPRLVLRVLFKADYVLCAAPALNRQMAADPADFAALRGTEGESVRLFAVRPD